MFGIVKKGIIFALQLKNTSMKTVTITVSGKTESDIEAGINEAKKRILQGNVAGFGFDSNEDGEFNYECTGEFEEPTKD